MALGGLHTEKVRLVRHLGHNCIPSPGSAGARMHPGTCPEWVNNCIKAADWPRFLPFQSKHACYESTGRAADLDN
jgi:hypothetical protein